MKFPRLLTRSDNMAEKRHFGDIGVEEWNDRFETYDAIPNDSENKVHLDRVSVKFTSDAQDERR